MYKRIITTILACAVMLTASSALAAENGYRVNISEKSCILDVSFENAGDSVNSTSTFTADKDAKLIVVAENTAVRILNSAGEAVAEKSADKGYVHVPVQSGEEYSINVISVRDNYHASVYVYGF